MKEIAEIRDEIIQNLLDGINIRIIKETIPKDVLPYVFDNLVDYQYSDNTSLFLEAGHLLELLIEDIEDPDRYNKMLFFLSFAYANAKNREQAEQYYSRLFTRIGKEDYTRYMQYLIGLILKITEFPVSSQEFEESCRLFNGPSSFFRHQLDLIQLAPPEIIENPLVLERKADYYSALGDHVQAALLYQSIFRFPETEQYPDYLNKIHRNAAASLKACEKYSEALQELDAAITAAEQGKNQLSIEKSKLDKALLLFNHMGDLQTARMLGREVFDNTRDKNLQINALFLIGSLQIAKEDYEGFMKTMEEGHHAMEHYPNYQSKIHLNAAESLKACGKYPEALYELDAAIIAAEEGKNQHSIEKSKLDKAFLLFNHMGDYQTASTLCRDVLDHTSDKDLRFNAIFLIGSLQIAQGDYEGSIAIMKKGHLGLLQDGDHRSAALLSEFIAYNLGFLGKYDEAIAILTESLSFYQENGLKNSELKALRTIASYTIDKGDTAKGVAIAENALSQAEETKDYSIAARLCNLIAVSWLYHLHNDEKANHYLVKAKYYAAKTPTDAYEYISALLTQAEYFQKNGKLEDARNNLTDAEKKSLTPEGAGSLVAILQAKANFAEWNGNREDLLLYKKKIIDYYHQQGLKHQEGDAWNDLAMKHLENKEYDDALSANNNASSIYQEIKAISMLPLMKNTRALIYALKGDTDHANTLLTEMMDNTENSCSDWLTLSSTFLGAGALQQKAGNHRQAILLFKKSMEYAEQIRSSLPQGDIRIEFQSQEISLYDAIIRSYAALEDEKNVFFYMEQAKSRVLTEQLRFGSIPVPDCIDRSMAEQEDHLLSQMRSIESTPGITSPATDIAKKLYSVWSEIEKNYPSDSAVTEYLSIRRGVTDDVTFFEQSNDFSSDALILSYYMLDKELIIIIQSPGSNNRKLKKVPTLDRILKSLCDQYLLALKSKDQSGIDNILEKISEYLITPIERYLPLNDHIVIIPHKILHLIPFQALSHEKIPLVEKYSISYSPSVSVLLHLEKRKRKSGSGAVIITEKPDVLPFCKIESDVLASLTGSSILTEDYYHPQIILPLLSTAEIVSFSCHAEFQDDSSHGSYIRLPGKDEEEISPPDIFKISMCADIVTLNCCQTARSSEHPGDEQIGLIRAFLHAGAKKVLASLWPVDDVSGSFLIIEFYTNILRNNMGKSDALAHAQRVVKNMTHEEFIKRMSLLKEKGYNIPVISDLEQIYPGDKPFMNSWYWAPMTLSGACDCLNFSSLN